MADITREIEITAALSSDYQAAFNAATSIARSTAKELSTLTKREADLARMTEIAGQSAKASAEGDAKAVDRLNAEYGRLANRLGLVDKSAEGLQAELKRIGARRAEIEALNRSAARSSEIGRLARDIQTYTRAAQRIRDPALLAQLERMKKRFRELGGVIPDKKRTAGFVETLRTGFSQIGGPIGGVVQSLGVLKSAFSTTGGAAGLAVGAITAAIASLASAAVSAGKALWDLGKETIAEGDRIAKTSRQLGIASDAYQELAYAVGLGGASEQDFDTALRQLNKQMEAATAGNGKAVKAFQSLGISMSEVRAMNPEEMFMRMSDALSEVDDVAAKTRTTMALFGEGGVKVATALSGGSAAIAKMRDEARKAGYVMDGKALSQSEEATDNFTRAQLQLHGVFRQLGVEIMPAINEILETFIQLIRDNREEIGEFVKALGHGVVDAVRMVIGGVRKLSEWFDAWKRRVMDVTIAVAKLRGRYRQFSDSLTEFVHGIPGKIAVGISSAWKAIKAWFADMRAAISAWAGSIADMIVSGVKDALSEIPFVGDYFRGDGAASAASAVAGAVSSITVQQNIDARGAAPGAEVGVQRAIRQGNAESGAAIAGAAAQYAALSYSGASR